MEGTDQRSQRLFLALWPELALQRRLVAIAESLPGMHRGGRHVQAMSVHVTLAFLGQVDATQRACIERNADDVRVTPFELALDRIGCFRRRRLLWIGATRVPAPLQQLVAELKAAQGACGLVPDERDYHVHVTLARGVRRCPPDTAIEPILWPVREFVLVRSDLGAGAGRYDVVRTWPLR